MTRFSLLALFALAFSGATIAAPPGSQEVVVPGDVHTSNGWSYTNCGISSDIVTIKSLTVSPDPPKPGQDLTVTVSAVATEVIEDGAYADVTVKLGLIKILHKTFDLCEEAKKANSTIRCPVQKGDYVVQQTASLPKEIPPGKFNVAVRGYTANDEDMVCLDLVVDFRPFRQLVDSTPQVIGNPDSPCWTITPLSPMFP